MAGSHTAWTDDLRARLRAGAPARRVVDWTGWRPAAVLVPIVLRPAGPALLFTVRGEGLSSHAGQVAFPGGGVEERDADRVATALREAEEELGVAAAAVEPLGLLGDQATPSRFAVTPVVAVVAPEAAAALRPDPVEVAEVFEAALGALPAVFEHQGEVVREGRSYELCVYRPAGHTVWGATARIVRDLLALLG